MRSLRLSLWICASAGHDLSASEVQSTLSRLQIVRCTRLRPLHLCPAPVKVRTKTFFSCRRVAYANTNKKRSCRVGQTEVSAVYVLVHSILVCTFKLVSLKLCHRKKRPLAKCCVAHRWTGDIISPRRGEKKWVKRFFALIPVVVWEVASETPSALLMPLHLLSFALVRNDPKRWFCHNRAGEELQSIWAPMAKTDRRKCYSFIKDSGGSGESHQSPPLRTGRTRRGFQRRHPHLQQDWKKRLLVKKWITGRLINAIIFSGFRFGEGGRRSRFQLMTDREGQGGWSPSVLLLKILESSCWMLLWINAIWLVASAVQRELF